MLRKILVSSLILFFTLQLSNCYRVPVPQGNSLLAHNVTKIKPGMTPDDVVAILGTPVLNNTFANNQMTYVYSRKVSAKPIIIKRVIVYFSNNRVVNITSETNNNR